MAKGKAKAGNAARQRPPGNMPPTADVEQTPTTPTMAWIDGLDHPITKNLCKRLNRFYESVVLLTSLREAHHRTGQTRAPSDTESGESPSRTFECFVNKLAQVCDSRRGGDTVTSLAILRLPDKLLYVFASNQRSSKEIDRVSEFIYSLLYYVGTVGAQAGSFGDEESSTMFRHLLRNILAFNSNRVKYYAKGLARRLGECIADCERDNLEHSKVVEEELLRLRKLAVSRGDGDESESSSDASLPTDHESLVRAATALLQSPTYGRIVDRAKIGRIDESPHWSELEHFIGRLASYSKAVQAIMGARRRFPELFEVDALEVHFLASSTPLPNPMTAFQPGLPPMQRRDARSAHDLIARMAPDKSKIETYRQYAEELQRCGLDERIAEQCSRPAFRPVVHSEVLLLEWLCDAFAGEMHSAPFYGGVKYIGCSKPTCRLCDCYFAAHSSGVRARSPHPNVYPNWAVPGILDEEGGEASRARTAMVDAVLVRIREDVFRSIREKVSERKRFDSNTCSSQPTFRSHASVSVSLNDLSSRLRGLSMAAGECTSHRVIKNKTVVGEGAWSVVAEEGEPEIENTRDANRDSDRSQGGDGDDDDGEGVIVYSGRKMRFI